MSAKFTCQFTLDTDAWHDEHGEIQDYSTQADAVLCKVIGRLHNHETGGVIRDVNGTKIGSWKLR